MEMKRATLRAFDSATYTATVEVIGSLSVWLSGVPVSRNIASTDLVSGRKVALIFFDASNQNDAVLCAVWT